MVKDIYLSVMKWKDRNVILGYYKDGDKDKFIKGLTPEEFITNMRHSDDIRSGKVDFHSKSLPYYNQLTPRPKSIDDDMFKEVVEADNKTYPKQKKII